MTRTLLDTRILYIKVPIQTYRFLHSSCDHMHESDQLLFLIQIILLLLIITQIKLIVIIVVVVIRNTTRLHGLPIRKAVVLVVHIKVYRQSQSQHRRDGERVLGQTWFWRRRRWTGADGRRG